MRKLPDGTKLEADVCVIGAGPGGTAIAGELAGLNLDVVVLESGGPQHDERIQRLNDGTMMGDSYEGLRETRYRGLGGAAHLWNTPVARGLGAKYVPLDVVDFEQRPDETLSAWPFDRTHLEPFYKRAQAVCGLGPFKYEGNDWAVGGRTGLTLASDTVTTGVYQFGGAAQFTEKNVGDLLKAGNIRVYHHATACKLETNGSGSRVAGAQVTCFSGKQFYVRSGVFVLAAGAIENARLLLISCDSGQLAMLNKNAWVGTCFMEHPRDQALTLIPHSPGLFSEARFHDAHRAWDGTIIGGRLGISGPVIRAARFPNASITLLPRAKEPRPADALANSPVRARLQAYLRRFGAQRSTEGYGWSRIRDPWRVFDAFRLIVNLEQRPNPANRVLLSSNRDELGIPKVEVHWRWRDEEQAELERFRAALAGWLEETDVGRVQSRSGLRPDPNAHHHAGTTRMATDPRAGVVDADCRVHGIENLYIAGASVFPTAGFSNPTLTIVALALRLADLLKRSA
ncbi:MAG: GMC oxidoreductase [Gemmatimonadaceae bacterium]